MVAEFNSSVVSKVKYEAKSKILTVVLNGGGEYSYAKVPSSIFAEFCDAKSAGVFWNTRIKNKFDLLK